MIFKLLVLLTTVVSSLAIGSTETTYINTKMTYMTYNDEGERQDYLIGKDRYEVLPPEGLSSSLDDVAYGTSVVTDLILPSNDSLKLITRIFSASYNTAAIGFEFTNDDITKIALNAVNRKYLFNRKAKNRAWMKIVKDCLNHSKKIEDKIRATLYNVVSVPFYCGPHNTGAYFELKINVEDREDFTFQEMR